MICTARLRRFEDQPVKCYLELHSPPIAHEGTRTLENGEDIVVQWSDTNPRCFHVAPTLS